MNRIAQKTTAWQEKRKDLRPSFRRVEKLSGAGALRLRDFCSILLRIRQNPRRIRKCLSQNPPVTASLCQPPLGKGAFGAMHSCTFFNSLKGRTFVLPLHITRKKPNELHLPPHLAIFLPLATPHLVFRQHLRSGGAMMVPCSAGSGAAPLPWRHPLRRLRRGPGSWRPAPRAASPAQDPTGADPPRLPHRR